MTVSENQILEGRYHLIEKLGEGTTGTVFRVWDTARRDEIILKILHPDLVAEAGGFSQISPLLASIANLHHPGIASVIDYKEMDDNVVICMEQIQGARLCDWLERPSENRQELAQHAESLVDQLIEAVTYAGSKLPLLSLNSRNVWISNQFEIRLTDIGQNRISPALNTIHVARQNGTEHYLAPEWHQIDRAQDIDSRSDQFSLGMLVFEILQARRGSFLGPLGEDDWREINPGLRPILKQLTQHRPQDRFADWPTLTAAYAGRRRKSKPLTRRTYRQLSSLRNIIGTFAALGSVAILIFLIRHQMQETTVGQKVLYNLAETRQLLAETDESEWKGIGDLMNFPHFAPSVLPHAKGAPDYKASDWVFKASELIRDGKPDLAIDFLTRARQRILTRKRRINDLSVTLSSLKKLRSHTRWHEQLGGLTAAAAAENKGTLSEAILKTEGFLTHGFFSRAALLSTETLSNQDRWSEQFMHELLQTVQAKQQAFERLLSGKNLPIIEVYGTPGKRLEEATIAIAERRYFQASVDLQIAQDLYARWMKEWKELPEPAPNLWVNSLGMPFAQVGPFKACIWETRRYDFAVFSQTSGHDSRRLWLRNAPNAGITHPVISITRRDATLFCRWLTKREQESGLINANEIYRIPTDLEWSYMVGLPTEEGVTPQERSWADLQHFPWGKNPTRQPNSGNYDTWPSANVDNGYFGMMDPWLQTAPVGRFPPNQWGLHDLGGNVWEWVEDKFRKANKAQTARGGGWRTMSLHNMRSNARRMILHDDEETGFRVILDRIPDDLEEIKQ